MNCKTTGNKKRDMRKERQSVRRSFLAGFVLTLLFCSFLLFSGLALYNTAIDLHGRDVSLMQMERITRETPLLSLKVFDSEYIIDLSGANKAADTVQKYYPALPRSIRGISYLLEELRTGVQHLIEQYNIQKENRQLV